MVANQVKLVGGSPNTFTVDLTNCNVSVAYRMSNPVIVVPVPKKQAKGKTPAASTPNVYTINLTMIQQNYDLSFTLTDGCGSFEFVNANDSSTNFEKLGNMSNWRKTKYLYINDRVINVEITAFTTTWEPGRKNLAVGCRMSLIGDVFETK